MSVEMTDGLCPFPDPADVFVPDQLAYLAERIHPLVSIDLATVDPAWSGIVHLCSPIEPVEGYLGDGTESAHTPWARTNWIGFAIEDDRYRFLGDPGYFQVDSDPDSLREDYAVAHASYRAHRGYYRAHGSLVRLDDEGRPQYGVTDPVDVVAQRGGQAGYGNWADPSLFPMDLTDPADIRPLDPDGRPFTFVAAVPGWHYRGRGADEILLFWQPESRRALLTFDWS